MEQTQLSSPINLPSASTPGSSSRQPTYTTAGTIYDPSSAQPLQAPARRGRSFKWAAGGINTELALLPKSSLATLPIHAYGGPGRNGSAVRYQTPLQYTPLQQNFDRAANPFHGVDPALANMPSLDTPQMRSGNVLNAGPSTASQENQKHPAGDSVEESDDDGAESDLTTLLAFPVKTLHNLASYPNPNQKRAQKALLSGAKPFTTEASSSSRGGLAPVPDSRYFAATDNYSTGEQSTANQQGHHERSLNPGLLAPRPLRGFAALRNPSPEQRIASTLSNGPGAPRPLTAGPPGQRQYRPSTFESTFKALNGKTELRDFRVPDDNDGSRPSPYLANETYGSHIDHSPAMGPVYLPSGIMDAIGDIEPETIVQPLKAAHVPDDFLPPLRTSPYHREVLGPVGSDARSGLVIPPASVGPLASDHWTSLARQRDNQPGGRSAVELRLRAQWIDSHWYKGNRVFGEHTTMSATEGSVWKNQNEFGVIGDRRQSKGEGTRPKIEVSEANRMPVSEHSQPLLEMLMTTLHRLHGEHHIDRAADNFEDNPVAIG